MTHAAVDRNTGDSCPAIARISAIAEVSPSLYSPRIALPATRLLLSEAADCSSSRAAELATPHSPSIALARMRGSASLCRSLAHHPLRLARPTSSAAFD